MWKSEKTVKNSIEWKFGAVLVILLVIGCVQELISPVDAGIKPNGFMIVGYKPMTNTEYSETATVKQNGVVIHVIYFGDIDTIPVVLGDSLHFRYQRRKTTRMSSDIAVNGGIYIISN